MTRRPPSCSLWLSGSAAMLAAMLLGCGNSDDGTARPGARTGSAAGSGTASTGSSGSTGTGGGDPGFIEPLNPNAFADAESDANPCGTTIPVLFRDMKFASESGGHPDFESVTGQDDIGCGIVMSDLGDDHRPAFQASNGVGQRFLVNGVFDHCKLPWDYTPSMTVVQSADTFKSWYHTDSNYSVEVKGTLSLSESPAGSGKFVYDSTAFFPIDNQGWGNSPGQQHNYSFTTEIHLLFGYVAGQVFTFRGDDDLWIFVNNRLALDLGGCHNALQATIDFDKQAADLGIVPGQTYAMDIFHAERHTSASNFRFETNISCFQAVDYGPIK